MTDVMIRRLDAHQCGCEERDEDEAGRPCQLASVDAEGRASFTRRTPKWVTGRELPRLPVCWTTLEAVIVVKAS